MRSAPQNSEQANGSHFPDEVTEVPLSSDTALVKVTDALTAAQGQCPALSFHHPSAALDTAGPSPALKPFLPGSCTSVSSHLIGYSFSVCSEDPSPATWVQALDPLPRCLTVSACLMPPSTTRATLTITEVQSSTVSTNCLTFSSGCPTGVSNPTCLKANS